MPPIRPNKKWMSFALLTLIFLQGIIISEYLASQLDGYSSINHYISELGQEGASFKLFFNSSVFFPVGSSILLLVYLIHANINNSQKLKWAGYFLSLPGIAYVGAAFFPCLPGCPLVTIDPTQIIHNILGLIEYMGAITGIAIWATWFKKVGFVGYTFLSWVALSIILVGSITMIIPYFSEYRGLLMRLADYSYFTWLFLLTRYAFSRKKDLR